MVAYCMNDCVVIQISFLQNQLKYHLEHHMLTEDFHCLSKPEDLFAMDDETFDYWMKYHLCTCERQDLIGATNHSLDILQKLE